MIQIKELPEVGGLPIPLLLTADPDLKKVNSYYKTSKIFTAELNDAIVGVYVLKIKTDRPRIHFGNKAEILNIAVEEKHQNKGIGKQLIQHAIDVCKKEKINTLEVGTGNSSISQIAFYQKCGFRMTGIIKDYLYLFRIGGERKKNFIFLSLSLGDWVFFEKN